ncbi:2-hydroxychromene-2-carboxylate isomerase [Halieaceae bacterium IMCC14734]|uniref:2-hydroxychromene-2-carboxylate isomerase n=1 Tax=Candidatus Litorirhabdus singularis TaxID=2518993 RepID=A0ABT3TDN5_9GAMM|nr:DsbA family protein [Candidatus Litorirhabdus singularis]MCX2980412.1 2-hydroxychromene-2-carboxylate isomerase [Candidatus Litorirhabdus singularis]
MPAQINLYWSFRSPYSYLATPGALQLVKDFDAEIQFRPVLPLALRQPDFFSPENQKRARYIRIDYPRRAAMLGLPQRWPSPDPIVQDMQTFKIAEDQPYIHRLTYLGVEAQRRGRGIEFAASVSRMIFGGTRDWDQGDHLTAAAAAAGLDLDAMEAAIEDPADHLAEVAENQHALENSGHWGVPTFVYADEPFFGQDRLDSLRWRLEQDGLRKN